MEDTPTAPRLNSHHHPARPMTLRRVVFTRRVPRLPRNRGPPLTPKRAGPFGNTSPGRPWIIGRLVKVAQRLQTPDRVAREVPAPPALDEPRCQGVVLRAGLTGGRERDSPTANATSGSARPGNVHRPSPAGGAEQARLVQVAATLPARFPGAPRRGFSSRALGTPTTGDSVRTRALVVLGTPHP
jgi:hypothetical protein